MNSSRDNSLWLQMWKDDLTDFHQQTVNPLLARFWSLLHLPTGSRVFVPLCGKSLDLIWLAGQGHKVIGVEISPIAVKDFFDENRLRPHKVKQGKFTLWTHGKISILCGDYFSLRKHHLGTIDALYDRAALTALPTDLRQLYVTQLRKLITNTTQTLLLTTEDEDSDSPDVPALAIDSEITKLYDEFFDIKLVHIENLMERHPEFPDQPASRVSYKAYRLGVRD